MFQHSLKAWRLIEQAADIMAQVGAGYLPLNGTPGLVS